MKTVTERIERRLAVADEAFVAQVVFFGPRTGDYEFYWRISANGMAHPARDFGTQQIRLRPLAEISSLLEKQAKRNEARLRRMGGL
jgi:hypothetical protein